MDKNFKVLSLSYKNAPIEVREKAALDENEVYQLLSKIKEFSDLKDALILSTCNRTEIYYYNQESLSNLIIKLILLQKNLTSSEDLVPYFVEFNQHEEAVAHLFRVGVGLEAQVIGDIQISNQIKRAYQASADMDMAGPFLHRIMHTLFYANKKIVQQTPFRDGAASVSYAATELVRTLSSNIIEPRILVVGLGEIGEDVVKNLVGDNIANIKICNRTFEKSQALATEYDFQAIPFEDMWVAISEADIVISSVNKADPLITKDKMEALNINTFKYFIDLSVPRSISLDVEELVGVEVYNVDNIKSTTDEALKKRVEAIPEVEKIINDAIFEFDDWAKEMIVNPTIQKFKNALEEIRLQELSRYVKNLDEEQSKTIDKITKSLLQKIIKMPVIQLKAACKRGEVENMIDILNDLFDLEKNQSSQKK